MPLTNPNKVVTEERLSEFYRQILPYMGGMPDVLANKFSKGDLYSTDEKMIGCWTDGKPLYKQTLINTIDSSSDWQLLFNLGEKEIKNVIGYAQKINGDYVQIGYGIDKTGDAILDWATWSGAFYIVLYKTYGGTFSLYTTILYTKTTDSPIAIGVDTDYSTDEKIVGTWIDGKPIYQKTGVSNNHTGDVSVALPTGVDGSTIKSINAYKIDGSDFLPFGVIWDTSNSINVYATGSTLHLIDTKSNRSGTFYYTIQYTKTS